MHVWIKGSACLNRNLISWRHNMDLMNWSVHLYEISYTQDFPIRARAQVLSHIYISVTCALIFAFATKQFEQQSNWLEKFPKLIAVFHPRNNQEGTTHPSNQSFCYHFCKRLTLVCLHWKHGCISQYSSLPNFGQSG
jgi:hypothetical protein